MRTVLILGNAIVLGLLTLGLSEETSPPSAEGAQDPGARSPAPPPEGASPHRLAAGTVRLFKLAWEHSGKNVAGGDVELDHAEVALTVADHAIWSPDAPIATIRTGIVKGANETDLRPLLDGRAPGRYYAWIRAVGKNGVSSQWAGPAEFAVEAPGSAASGSPGAEAPERRRPARGKSATGDAAPPPDGAAPGAASPTDAPRASEPAPSPAPSPAPWGRPPPPKVSRGCFAD